MERSGISQDGAVAVLRREARDAKVTVRQHAENVVRSAQRGPSPAPSDG
jgi:AmiR/NasT family two-component response regulator